MTDNDNPEIGADSEALARETEDFLGTASDSDSVDADSVRFHQLGQREERFAMVGSTLGELLQKKGLTLESGTVLYNGVNTTNPQQELEPGSLVYYAHRIRGGHI